MAVRVIGWAIEQPNLDPTTKLILILLADIADEHGKCWPGQKRLAALSNITDRSLRRHLGILKEAGLLTAQHRYGTSDLYQLSYDRKNLPVDPPGHQCPVEADTSVRYERTPASDNPSVEPSDTRQGRSGKGTRLPEDWCAHPDDIERAREWGLTTETISFQIEEFKDFWKSVPGERGRKADWRATFRNRLRDVAGRRKTEAPNVPRPAGKVLPSGRLEFKPEPKKITHEEWKAQRANGKTKTGGQVPLRETEARTRNPVPQGVHNREPSA